MPCRCISYNQPEKGPSDGDREVVLRAPSWSSRETICVDACIVRPIKALWAAGIRTAGCCCGHNHHKPSVVLDLSSDAARSHAVLRRVDRRAWDVLSWQLCSTSPDGIVAAWNPLASVIGGTSENGEPATASKLPGKSRLLAPLSPVRSSSRARGKREPRGHGRKAVAATPTTQGAK